MFEEEVVALIEATTIELAGNDAGWGGTRDNQHRFRHPLRAGLRARAGCEIRRRTNWYCTTSTPTPSSECPRLWISSTGQWSILPAFAVEGKAILTQPDACDEGQVLVYSLSTTSFGVMVAPTPTAPSPQQRYRKPWSRVASTQDGTAGREQPAGGSPILSEASTLNPAMPMPAAQRDRC